MVFPVTVATSDCIRFSPGGQRRLELICCLKERNVAFPSGVSCETFYLDSVDDGSLDRDFVAESDCGKEFLNGAISELLDELHF